MLGDEVSGGLGGGRDGEGMLGAAYETIVRVAGCHMLHCHFFNCQPPTAKTWVRKKTTASLPQALPSSHTP